MALAPFHIAFPVDDRAAARKIYGTTLGCPEGRSSDSWIDFDLFGHQIVAHVKPASGNVALHNPVDGHDVPGSPLRLVLPMDEWHALAERLRVAGVSFVIEPHIRFPGQVGEQATMFFFDSCWQCAGIQGV
jgi:uncharacterized protein